MDWLDASMRKNLVIEKVSPNDIDEVVGILDGVDRASSSLECGYYTDTRTSGTLSVVGDSWQRNVFLRPVLELPDMGLRRELGTYLVWDDGGTRDMNTWTYSLKLHSLLYGLSTEVSGSPWTIATNAKALTAIDQMLNRCGRPHNLIGANDFAFKSAKVLEADKSWLSRLYALCDVSNNRLDIDGHGRVTVSSYVLPSAKTPILTIDVSDPQGVVQSLSRSSSALSMAGQVVVYCKYTETSNGKTKELEIVGRANATGDSSRAVRGFMVTDFREIQDLSPRTVARANQLAAQYLQRATTELVEWNVKTPYLPLWEGDVVSLVVHDGLGGYQGERRCLVKSISLDLLHLEMSLTLKEVASGDWEEGA